MGGAIERPTSIDGAMQQERDALTLLDGLRPDEIIRRSVSSLGEHDGQVRGRARGQGGTCFPKSDIAVPPFSLF